MITWSEVVKKEKSTQKVYENFTINPHRRKWTRSAYVVTYPRSVRVLWKA